MACEGLLQLQPCRKHRVIKRFANPRHNTVQYDRGILEEATVQHLFELRSSLTVSDLVDPRPAPPKMIEAVRAFYPGADGLCTARIAMVRCRAVCVGDVVVCQDGDRQFVAEVFFHVKFGTTLLTCLSEWALCTAKDGHLRVRVADDPRLVPLTTILESCVYSRASKGQLSDILVPPGCRRL